MDERTSGGLCIASSPDQGRAEGSRVQLRRWPAAAFEEPAAAPQAVPQLSPATDAATQRPMISLSVARSHHAEQLSQQTSSKASMYRSIKIGYACEPYIQQTSNRHLRRILAQFRTGLHWLNIATGRHRKQDRKDRTCPMCTHRIINPGLPPEEFDAFDSDEECSDPIEDEHHAIFDCSAYADAREQYRDLFQIHFTTVGDFLNQPQCNRLATLTWIRMLRMNRA